MRVCMRQRPCLPLAANGSPMSYSEVSSGDKLPLYSCPFIGCSYSTSTRMLFLHHIAGGVADTTHLTQLNEICNSGLLWMTKLDYVYGAIAIAERERWPRIGLSTTRRSLNELCQRYNDDEIQCLTCFTCSQMRSTAKGYPTVDLETLLVEPAEYQHEILLRKVRDFQFLEEERVTE